MPHEITWDNSDKTVVLQQYLPGATKEDLYHLAKKSQELLDTVSHTVHLIIDERPIVHTLNSADLNYLEKHVPPNQGTVIVVVRKEIQTYKTLVQNIGHKVAPHAFAEPFFAHTVEEAREILTEKFGVKYP